MYKYSYLNLIIVSRFTFPGKKNLSNSINLELQGDNILIIINDVTFGKLTIRILDSNALNFILARFYLECN